MSQENVEIERKAIQAWNQREADLLLSYAAPDIEWMPARQQHRPLGATRSLGACARAATGRARGARHSGILCTRRQRTPPNGLPRVVTSSGRDPPNPL